VNESVEISIVNMQSIPFVLFFEPTRLGKKRAFLEEGRVRVNNSMGCSVNSIHAKGMGINEQLLATLSGH